MINNIDIEKSFYMIGESKTNCFDCKYCRVISNINNPISYKILPTEINPNFKNLPISINLYYGDPFLISQIKSTYEHLLKLKESKHKGPIVLITKGDISNISWLNDDTFCDLDLHIALSTFGIYHKYDKHSHSQFLKNLDINIKYKKSIEFRPICYGINDSFDIIEGVFKLANKYNLSIGYSGLQGKPDLVKYWSDEGFEFKPYPGYDFGHKKSISEDVQKIFDKLSIMYNVPIFRKTSCLISYVHGLERDYNAHYYRPNEMGCDLCIMKDNCFSFKSKLTNNKDLIKDKIPFEFDIIYKKNHECILKKKNICKFPTADCSKIEGNIIKINNKLTTADVRVIKWLTGYTVDADFIESQYLSDNWKLKNQF